MEYRLIDGADPWQSVIDAIKDLKSERDALSLQLSSARKQLDVLSGQLKTSRETLRHIRNSISELRFTVAKLNDGMGDLVDDLEFWGAVEDDRHDHMNGKPSAERGVEGCHTKDNQTAERRCTA